MSAEVHAPPDNGSWVNWLNEPPDSPYPSGGFYIGTLPDGRYRCVKWSQGQLRRSLIPADEADVTPPNVKTIRSQKKAIAGLIARGDTDPELPTILARLQAALDA